MAATSGPQAAVRGACACGAGKARLSGSVQRAEKTLGRVQLYFRNAFFLGGLLWAIGFKYGFVISL